MLYELYEHLGVDKVLIRQLFKNVVAIFPSNISGKLQGIYELVSSLYKIFRYQLVFKSLLQDSHCKMTYTNMSKS